MQKSLIMLMALGHAAMSVLALQSSLSLPSSWNALKQSNILQGYPQVFQQQPPVSALLCFTHSTILHGFSGKFICFTHRTMSLGFFGQCIIANMFCQLSPPYMVDNQGNLRGEAPVHGISIS